MAASPLCKGATLRAEEGAAAGGRKPPPSRHQGRRRQPYSRHQIGQIVAKVMLALLYAPPPRLPARPPAQRTRTCDGPLNCDSPLSPSPRRSLLAVCCGWKLRGYCTAAGRAAVRRATRTKRPEPVAPGVVLPSSSARRRPSKRGRTSADPAPRHPLLLPSPSPGSAAVADHTQ